MATRDENVRGFGSVNREERDSMTLNNDSAGDQLCLRMSIQMLPLSDICIENQKSILRNLKWRKRDVHSCGIY